MQGKHPSSPASKKFKTQASAGKVVLTIFLDVNGPILVHFQEKGQTVTSARYSDMLVNELKPAIRSNAADFYQREYCCFTTMPTPMRLCIHYVLWNLRCWNILHTVWTWRHQTFTCLDLWKNICGGRSLQMTR